PVKACILTSNGYTAPEKSLTEQGDVFSFGVILLELLTSKTVEKSGIDLPKWVRAMVREEWTGEVFDKEVSKAATQWAFPLLNIALKCVSDSAENRPNISEIWEKIEEVVNAQRDHSNSPRTCCESNQHECCLLHTILPDTWEYGILLDQIIEEEMESDLGKLFIGGISWDTDEERLKDYFRKYGEVVEAVIMRDRATGRARGFGFVVFADPAVAERVIMDKHIIDGRTVEAKKAVPKDDQHSLNRNTGSVHGSPGPGSNY
ncbi:probable leucine-rich repeat receptor-like protein kinase IMK3, partial [Fagus crenata]